MPETNNPTHNYAKKLSLILVVVYAVIKQSLLLLDDRVDPVSFSLRAVASLLMILVVIVLNRKLPARKLSIFIPVSIAFIEIMWVAFVHQGEWLFYFFLIGCSLLSVLFLYPKGLLISIGINSAILALLSFVLGIRVSGLEFLPMDDFFAFVAVSILNMLIYFICKQATNTFSRFRKTGEAFEKLLETSPSLTTVINERGRVDHITQAMAGWFGISDSQFARERIFLDLSRRYNFMHVIQKIMETDDTVEEIIEIEKSGKTEYYILRSSKLDQGGVARTFELTDITVITKARQMAEEADRQKSSFLANMSHEIRTPMNAIVGMTELMLTTNLNDEQQSHLLTMRSSAMSLLTIINDILDFSKLTAKKMEIITVPFDIGSLLNDTLSIINIKAQSAELALTAFISKDIPAKINGDEVRIKQCLLNLMNNAVKFTKNGAVSLTMGAEHIESALKLSFAVKDTGVGMKKEDIGKLFGVFAQLDTKKNRNITGTGLGLSITKGLVEMMGGQVSVDSIYGEGSVFSFYIICKGSHKGEKLVVLEEAEKYNVLAYEPNEYHAEALDKTLNDLGIKNCICRSLSSFKEKMYGGYTHVIYDKSALNLIQKRPPPDAHLVMIKEVQDINIGIAAMNRPIIATSLVRFLSDMNSDGADARRGEIELGDFKTKNVHILLVDDNPINLAVAEAMLHQYGISVTTAADGKEGLEKIQLEDFDIAFFDHMMPVMDGVEATGAIRALGGRFEDIPIVALTANAISGVEKEFLDAGMSGYLPKPLMVKDLHNTLLNFLPAEKIVR